MAMDIIMRFHTTRNEMANLKVAETLGELIEERLAEPITGGKVIIFVDVEAIEACPPDSHDPSGS